MKHPNLIVLLLLPVFFLLTVFLFLYGFFTAPEAQWDEHTNVQVIGELSTAQSPFLTLNGQPFFEKPPIFYYLSVLVLPITGNSLKAGRLISVLSSFFLTVLLLLVSYRLSPKTAVFTLLTFISTGQLFFANAGQLFSTHTLWSADVDALHILFLFLAYACLSQKKPRFFLAALCTAISVLTKGPMGFVPIILFTILNGKQYMKELVRSWGLLIVCILPWYLIMTVQFGTLFLSANIGYHLFERMVIPLEGHSESFFYPLRVYLDPRVFLGFIPTLLALFSIKKSNRYLFFTTITFLLLPFLIQTKLAWYALPVYPFAALSVGEWLSMRRA